MGYNENVISIFISEAGKSWHIAFLTLVMMKQEVVCCVVVGRFIT